MAKNTTNTQITSVDTLRDEVMALSNTSQKIRHLIASYSGTDGKAIAFAYRKLKEYGVYTKDGNEIRYQHVRNIAMMKLTTK